MRTKMTTMRMKIAFKGNGGKFKILIERDGDNV